MIWLALAALVLVAAIVVLPPLLANVRETTHEATDLAVYRDQLKEVDDDAERGLISATEAEAARTEIKRRILALPQTSAGERMSTGSRTAASAVALFVAVVASGIYLSMGQPTLPGRPYDAAAEQAAVKDEIINEVTAMVEKLAARLKTQPNDAQGWRMLGWSYVQLGRIAEGIEALKRSVALDPRNAPLRSQLGEAIVQQADGTVTAEAAAVFDEALKVDAKDPRARFYKGLALVQAGKEKEALDLWVAIIRDGPPDAEWMPGLRDQATQLAMRLKLDPKTAVP
jgi:cytochrome c-type biogenesis protein CcmH